MRVCYCPNMAVVAVENPIPMKQTLFINKTTVRK
jgi:hypothetical protein